MFKNMFLYSAAFDFLKSHPVDPIDVKSFEQFCGVGVVISQDDINQKVGMCVRSKL